MEYVTLNNGIEMPMLGYGVYQVSAAECKQSVSEAIKAGYRLIDTAQSYFNESEVGEAVAESGIAREKFFITTKVWIEHYGYKETRASVIESMRKLKTDYLDLCLLHQPFNDVYGAYRALEDLYFEGKLRAVGISNFYPDRMVDIASFARVKPTVNQIEIHPHNVQTESRKWHEKYGVQLEAWAPLGEGRGDMFTLPELKKVAEKHGKTVAQVILRWHIQHGTVVIPKTVHSERMRENFDIFGFTLDSDDMAVIDALDRNESSFFSHTDPNMVEWFVKMVEERKSK